MQLEGWLAYCVDEAAFFYEGFVTQDNGEMDWNLIRWTDEERNTTKKILGRNPNARLMKHIESEVKKHGH